MVLLSALVFPEQARAKDPPVASTSAAVSPEKVKRAKALNHEGHELYLRGQYHAAIEKVEAAIALDPEGADLAYNLAVIYERLGELDKSERAYRRSLELELNPALRERTRMNLKRIEGAKREVAAKTAAPEAASAPPATRAPPPPRGALGERAPQREAPFLGGRSPWIIPAASISATALALGVGLGISAVVRNPGPAATTGNGISTFDIDREAHMAHLQAVLADVSFAVGAAAAGAAFYLYFFGPKSSSPSSAGKEEAARSAKRVEFDLGLRRATLRVVF